MNVFCHCLVVFVVIVVIVVAAVLFVQLRDEKHASHDYAMPHLSIPPIVFKQKPADPNVVSGRGGTYLLLARGDSEIQALLIPTFIAVAVAGAMIVVVVANDFALLRRIGF